MKNMEMPRCMGTGRGRSGRKKGGQGTLLAGEIFSGVEKWVSGFH
jgi:hypothetical protein